MTNPSPLDGRKDLRLDGQLQSLIDTVDVANDERTVKAALRTYAVACGFERFAYLQIAAFDIRTFNSYPAEWENIYLHNRYSVIDPVVAQAKRRMAMFDWSAETWPKHSDSREFRRFRSEAMDFGIRSGITTAIRGSFQSTLMLTLASSRARLDSAHVRDAEGAARAALCAYYRLKLLAERPGRPADFGLSPKELVCLRWAAKGKSMQDIADLTNVQHRTVQHYLDNVRGKLDAANLVQAVAIAKDHGLLGPE